MGLLLASHFNLHSFSFLILFHFYCYFSKVIFFQIYSIFLWWVCLYVEKGLLLGYYFIKKFFLFRYLPSGVTTEFQFFRYSYLHKHCLNVLLKVVTQAPHCSRLVNFTSLGLEWFNLKHFCHSFYLLIFIFSVWVGGLVTSKG